jgi:carboxymethylenebutenolidase
MDKLPEDTEVTVPEDTEVLEAGDTAAGDTAAADTAVIGNTGIIRSSPHSTFAKNWGATMGNMVDFKRPDGKQCRGYYAELEQGSKAPGVVVLQEWWGLNDQIKGVADRMAKAGYRALVPDLYRGKVALEAKEAEHLMKGLNFGDAAGQDVRGAVQYLKQSSPKVAVMGYCMGGALTILSAVFVREADAAVCWYGVPPLEYVDANAIKIPILGHFATEDQAFPRSQVEGLDKKLKEAKVQYEFHWYNAKHAFANENNKPPNSFIEYNAQAAELAWKRTMDFLKSRLKWDSWRIPVLGWAGLETSGKHIPLFGWGGVAALAIHGPQST